MTSRKSRCPRRVATQVCGSQGDHPSRTGLDGGCGDMTYPCPPRPPRPEDRSLLSWSLDYSGQEKRLERNWLPG